MVEELSRHAGIHPVFQRARQDAGKVHSITYSLERGTIQNPEELKRLTQKARMAIKTAGGNRFPLFEITTNQEANGPTNITINGTSPGAKRVLADMHEEIQRRKNSVWHLPLNTLHRIPPMIRRLFRFLNSRTFELD